METLRLDKVRVWIAQRIRFWALVVGTESEVGGFFAELARNNPKGLEQWLHQLDMIGQRDYFVGEKLFKQMKGWPGQWEVRRGDHRLMGFRVGDDVILCLHRVKHRDRADPRDLARVERFAREWENQYG